MDRMKLRRALALVVGVALWAGSGEVRAGGMIAPVGVPDAAVIQVQYYAPPPGYYVAPAPPPGYYPPQRTEPRDLNRAYDPDRDGPPGVPTQRGPVLYGTTCYAGPYVCQLPAAGPVGTGCSCPGWGAPSYGTIR